MGVTELKPGQDIRLSIEVTNFYRELTMTLGPRTVVLGQAVDNAGAAQ